MIYGYCRVSTQTQAEKGFGIDTQTEKIKSVYGDIPLFVDKGISGTETDRPGLNELLNTVANGDKVIVLNTSRLWRNDTVKVLIHHQLKKAGADIVSIEQPNYSVYSNDPNDFLINGILEILDQYDRMLISRKLASGRKTKAASGIKACGTAPFGYRWDNREIVIDRLNAPVVKEIFNLYAKYNNAEIVANILKQRSIKGNWSRQKILRIIHNDFYVGIVTHKGIKSQGKHQAIIGKTQFEQINTKRA